MSQRTTQSSVVIGDYTYIFRNRKDTDYIEYVRWKSLAQKVENGKIGDSKGYLRVGSGPIAVLVVGNAAQPQFRLYWLDSGNVIHEEVLKNAIPSDPKELETLWYEGDLSSGDSQMDTEARTTTASSDLTAGIIDNHNAIFFESSGHDNKIAYIKMDQTGTYSKSAITPPAHL